MSNYTLEIQDFERLYVIKIKGTFSTDNANELKKIMEDYAKKSFIEAVGIDIRDVSHIDSTGIGSIMSAFQFLKGVDKRIFLIKEFQPPVAKIMDNVGLSNFLVYAELNDIKKEFPRFEG